MPFRLSVSFSGNGFLFIAYQTYAVTADWYVAHPCRKELGGIVGYTESAMLLSFQK